MAGGRAGGRAGCMCSRTSTVVFHLYSYTCSLVLVTQQLSKTFKKTLNED